MAVYYFDSSALVKRYAVEVGTAWVLALVDPRTGNAIATARVTGPEVVAAFARKLRTGQLSAAATARLGTLFRMDWQSQYQILEISAPLVDRAMDLAEQHGLRGFDAIHLSAALQAQAVLHAATLPPLTFVSADTQQLNAAVLEGLTVDNPTLHP